MTGRVRSEDKVVRLAVPHVRSNGRRPSRLTEEERQILLSELAEVTAELNELQARTMEIAARVISTTPAQHIRPA